MKLIHADNQVERLESALREACKMGDRHADEIIRQARTVFRQRSAMRRAIAIARRGRIAEAVSILEAELTSSREGDVNDEGTQNDIENY
jgi:hypothetical protein